MGIKSIVSLSCVIASLVSVSANAATVVWEPTNEDTNFIIYSAYDVAMFDVDDYDGSKSNPLILNMNDGIDRVIFSLPDSNGDITATSAVTTASITLFNDAQFVLAITADHTNWYEPTTWGEPVSGTNVFGIVFPGKNYIVAIDTQIATVVPVPAAVWLFGSGLIGIAGIARRKV